MRAFVLVALLAGSVHAESVALPNPGPAAVVRVVFRAGAVDDPPGKEGLTAVVAKLLVEGGTQAHDSATIGRLLEPLGATLSVDVDKEVTAFNARSLGEDMNKVIPLLGEILTAPRWAPRELARLLESQRARLAELSDDDDEALSLVALDAALYPQHPYRHPVVGTGEGLAHVTVAEVRAHAQRVFTRERMDIIVVAPDPAPLVAQVNAAIRSLPERGAPPRTLPERGALRARCLIVEKPEAHATAMAIALPHVLPRRDPRFVGLLAAASALGDPEQSSSRLYATLRERRGLNYGTYAYAEAPGEGPGAGRHVQHLTIWIRPVADAQAVFALRAALYELSRWRRLGVPADELAGTASFLAASTRFAQQTAWQHAILASDDLFFTTHDFIAQLAREAKALTPAAVSAALAGAFGEAPAAAPIVAIVTRNAKRLRAELLAKASPLPERREDAALAAEDALIAREALPCTAQDTTIVSATALLAR